MPLYLGLEPNKMLLQSEFEGYKLNLRDLPHFSHQLEMPADQVYSDGVHANIFGPHNHLVFDPWDPGYSFYYIDTKHQVHHITFDGGYTFQDRAVYDVPTQARRDPGVCLTFADINLAVISDATGHLYIIDTGNRTKCPGGKTAWTTVVTSLPLGEKKSIVVVDCKVQETEGAEMLHCLLQSVETKDINYKSVISWIVYEQKEGSDTWTQVRYVDLKGKDKVQYAVLESNCDAVYVASDSSLEVIKLIANSKLQQTVCSFEILPKKYKSDISWGAECQAGEVNTNARLLKDTDIKKAMNRDEASAIVRLDAKTLKITHSIPVNAHEYLFSVHLENYEAPALVLCHGNNACIWQPYAQLIDSKMWPVKHQGTLMAFGYLQSAKYDRKFVTCAPNLSYGVMTDGKRHIFIYENDNNPVIKCKKVMRKTRIEQEHIFNMDEYGEVLGIYAANNNLFVLTQTYFIAIKIR